MTASITRQAGIGVSRKNLEYADQHLGRYIAAGKLTGASLFVTYRGEVVHQHAQGLMDRERAKPMREDTIVRLYSMTKPITSVAVMQLYERGLVQLDDPVHRYIPSWKNLGVYVSGNYPSFITAPCERPMTVRDLLSHQSGLTYGFIERTNVDAAYRKLGLGRDNCATLQEMIDRLSELPLECQPGTAWNYSVATDVLGYLVELIAGRRFDHYLREEIFEPLGMVDTGFQVRPEQRDRFAANYSPSPTGDGLALADDPATSVYLAEPTFLSGGGGLAGTGGDYLRFCQMLLGSGRLDGARILGRKTVDLMAANHLPGGKALIDVALVRRPGQEATQEGRGFGLGFGVALDPAQSKLSGTPGEISWGGAASTVFWLDRAEDLAVVFLTQYLPVPLINRYNLERELRALVYSALD